MRLDYDANVDLSQFAVTNAKELERTLHKLLDDQTIVTINSENGRDFLLTTLVGINPNTGFIYLACGPDERLNDALFAAENAIVTAKMSQARIQFQVDSFERAKYNGEIVFKTRIPSSLLRIQRREYYRMATSGREPIKCRFILPRAGLDVVVTDISVGGVGVLYPPGGAQLVAGETYTGCSLRLPGAAEFTLSLKVCSAYRETLKNGLVAMRAGCQFVKLPPQAELEVQRYVLKAERELKSRLG